MSREIAAEFLSLSVDTFDRLCPVQAVDLPFSGVRWSRVDLEEWIASLARRPRKAPKRPPPVIAPLDIPPPRMTADERRALALKKSAVRAR